jgi:hypothetical protein
MKWNCSLWLVLALIGSLFACQVPVLKPSIVVQADSPLEQALVPQTKGGTLGQTLVPESKGGTLGKGLVPESKGGTLGRFTLRGQVVAPAGFRVQAEAARRYRLQLSDPLQKQSWLELESDEQGRFEIGNLPVETLLKLEVISTNPAQVPLQLWFALPAAQAQSLQERNLDLASSAEGLLLNSLLLQTSELLPFVQAARSQTYLQAQAQMAALLLKHGFQVSALEADPAFAQALVLFQTVFEPENKVKPTVQDPPLPVETAAPLPELLFQAPESGRSFLLGSAIPLRFQLSKAHPEPVSVVFYANGEPLKNALGQPLISTIPAFSTTSQAVDGLLPSVNLGEWQLEVRLLNLQGETLNRVTGPRISLYSGGGGGSQPGPQPPSLDLIQAQVPALPGGLVAEFPAEGNGNDSSGLYTGLLQNEVAFGPGIQGRAFALNGSQGGIQVPSLDFAQKDYAVEVWFRTDYKQLQTLVKALPGFELQLLASGHLAFGHQPPALITSPHPVNDNRWHQAVAVRQGNQEFLFVDGQLLQSKTATLLDLNSAVAVHIGYQNAPNQQPFKGLIDNLRVYKQPLTALQVKTLFLGRVLLLTGSGFVADLSQTTVTANGVPLEVLSASSSEIQALVPDHLNGSVLVQVESGGVKTYPQTLQRWPLRVDQLSRSLLLTGDALTLTGVGFDLPTAVRLSGVQGTVQTLNSQSLVVTVPLGLVAPGPLQLNNGGATLMGPWLSPMPVTPVAWWRGEGNAQDSMGAYPGTLQGAVQFGPGKVGQAFLLQGGAHVDLGLIDAFQGSFTWTGWFRANAPTTQNLISGTQAGLPGLQLTQKNSQLGFLHRFPYGPAGGTESLAGNLFNGEWHHFAVVKTNLFQTLYIDGKSVNALDNASQFNTALQVLLGRIAPGDNSADFQGALDEICLFNQALSSAQIEQIYQYSR